MPRDLVCACTNWRVRMIHNILLLEDHPDAQTWLSEALHLAFGSNIHIDVAGNVSEGKAFESKNTYDLIVADLHLPDGSGIELVLQAKSSQPQCPCVVATIFSDNQHLFPALQAGADGYLLKDESKGDIAQMLAGILEGKPPISASVAQQMLQHFHFNPDDTSDLDKLSKREREVLIYLSKGMSTKDCADLMDISYHTASDHIRKVYRKLGVHSRAEATLEAVRLGIT
ncbi:MAG TPA: response regulator transcription factor [Mariprofundaceae bacterium]|nr:response regulator transcription factor [Mariprofundaceae bacterium]